MTPTPTVVSPEAIDGSFVPVGRESVGSVEIDGQVVLLDGATGTLRNLDPVGGVVWGCLDAPGTIDEIVADLCEEFGADRATVRDDVLDLMRALGREGLLQGVATDHPVDGHEGHGHAAALPATESDAGEPKFLEEPVSSWLKKLDRLVWAGSSTFRIGRLHIGVRCSNQAVLDLLRQALAAHLVEDVDAPSNYSILLAGDDPESKDRAFHFVYRGFHPVVRTRDPQRLVAGLLGRLAGHLDYARSEHVRLDSIALVAGDVAVLAPAEIRYVMPTLERRLNTKGMRVVDEPWTALDVETGELVVTEPALDVDHAALGRLIGAFPRPRRPDPAVAPGRYRLAGWAFGLGHAHNGPISRAQAVALACPQVLNAAELGAQRTLDGLARAIRTVDPVAVWADSPAGLVKPLADLAADGSVAT